MSPELALSEIANLVELIAGTPATKVQPDSTFVVDLGVDSLSMVEMLEGLQNSHGIVLTPKQVAEIKTVNQLMNLLVQAS